MGNGQKAQHRRERMKENAPKAAKSQLKINEKAKNIICEVCRTTFLCTVREKALQEHVNNKHAGKTFKDCFPKYGN
ncbi:DUF1909-domain-containing protein [Anaeromyces robustus]|uniref:DUF1909-domain-containing protein n=1 Tax=Anaeromyces robustus TaxID=1754192 RepID=A0A1Y1WUH1_9FUNG|nr:DUF1909-domain-containing protein [Anaeromyces robustus]|eukprot:ORX77191.1 DUF1909-domain-containing protein [Anaeromyces robustus]